MAGVAEDDEARAAQQLVAPLDENLAPAMGASARHRSGAVPATTTPHSSNWVSASRRAPRPHAAAAARASKSRMVAPVERRLAAREGQPDQGIEQVMAVVGARRDLAAGKARSS
jgi:hypothetical protein